MSLLADYRRRRALRLARRGLALLQASLHDSHLPRAVRRRILREITSGRVDPATLVSGDV